MGDTKVYDPEEHVHVKPVIRRVYSGEWQCKCGMNLGVRNRGFNRRYRAHINSEKIKENSEGGREENHVAA